MMWAKLLIVWLLSLFLISWSALPGRAQQMTPLPRGTWYTTPARVGERILYTTDYVGGRREAFYITLLEVQRGAQAWAMIHAADPLFNPPPFPGKEYLLIKVQVEKPDARGQRAGFWASYFRAIILPPGCMDFPCPPPTQAKVIEELRSTIHRLTLPEPRFTGIIDWTRSIVEGWIGYMIPEEASLIYIVVGDYRGRGQGVWFLLS